MKPKKQSSDSGGQPVREPEKSVGEICCVLENKQPLNNQGARYIWLAVSFFDFHPYLVK